MTSNRYLASAVTAILVCLQVACGSEDLSEQVNDFAGRSDESTPNTQIAVNHEIVERVPPAPNPSKNAYYGDLHVHTEYSFDAYSFGTTATPYDAYRYAKGAPLIHPRGYKIQLKQALDFYAVTDHAMFLGVVKEAADTSTEFSRYAVSELVHNINAPDNLGDGSMTQRLANFAKFIPGALAGLQNGSIDPELTLSIRSRPGLILLTRLISLMSQAGSLPLRPTSTPPLRMIAEICIAMLFSRALTSCRLFLFPDSIHKTRRACGTGWIAYASKV